MGLRELIGTAPPPGTGKRFGAWQIELTTRCPLSCRMCIRQGDEPWHSRDMSVADFERIAPHLSDVECVILQGWGEPLLHDHLVEIVRIAKRGRPGGGGAPAGPPAVGFVTSGKNLDRRYAAELVAAGLDFIGFSVAGVAPATHSAIRVHSLLDEVVSAAEHVAEARGRGGRSPRTHVVFLMLKDNFGELPELPALAARMAADEIVLTNLIHVVDPWQDEQRMFGREERSERQAILAETERRARARGIALRCASLHATPTAVCEEDPLRNLYVTVDGEVSPCVYLGPPLPEEFTRLFCGREHRVRRMCFGNALREEIQGIWESPGYASFRARFAARAKAQRLLFFSRLPDAPGPCLTCHKILGV